MGVRGEVFSWRTSSASDRRTYFFNLKENRTGDLFLTIVESKKHGETDFERHQIQVFEEDFDKFRVGIDKVFDFLREERGEGPRFASEGRRAKPGADQKPGARRQPGPHAKSGADHKPGAHSKPDGRRGAERPSPKKFRKREKSGGE